MLVQKNIIISGRVQGVGFRAFALDKAKQFNIKGWIKNRSDGKVEAVVQGKDEDLKKLLAFLKEGPAWARVEGINIKDEKVDTSIKEFYIK
ncbi:acylphosphatase [Natronospora cellulosivora (SeqCode)]